MEKSTQELMQMLSAEENIEEYLDKNSGEFLEVPLHEYLSELLQTKSVKKNDVIRRSGLNQIYAYQIFAGTKHPNRDKLLALAFGFPLPVVETQRLLRMGMVRELYPRDRRDSVIVFALRQKLTIQQTDDLLFELHLDTLL